jgi:hypothetical protein
MKTKLKTSKTVFPATKCELLISFMVRLCQIAIGTFRSLTSDSTFLKLTGPQELKKITFKRVSHLLKSSRAKYHL